MKTLFESQSRKRDPCISPDGRWLAFEADDSGRPEVYVQAFSATGERSMISFDGGTGPRWSHDGRELFYRNGNGMMAVDVQTTPLFRAGVPKILFQGRYGQGYDVAPDGKRFLMVKPDTTDQARVIEAHVVLNWFEEVRRRGANAR
jgi:hypothetical protein